MCLETLSWSHVDGICLRMDIPDKGLLWSILPYQHWHAPSNTNFSGHLMLVTITPTLYKSMYLVPGLHNLWYPGIRDRSTWGKFGAHGEHGDVFLFSNLGALWFSENFIRYSLHVCLREVKKQSFFLQTLLFTASLVTVLKILTYALGSTWSSVSSG